MNVAGMNIPHAIANMLGILTIGPKRTTADLIRGIFYITLFLCIIFFEMYGKIFVFGKDVHLTALSMYILSETFVTIMNIGSILQLNLRHSQKQQKFLDGLRKLEIFITDKENIEKNNRANLRQYYAIHLLGMVFSFFSGYFYVSTLGWDIYKFYIMREFQNTHFLVIMTIVLFYTRLIGLRMSDLNRHLVSCVVDNNIWCTNYKKPSDKLSIKTIAQAYTSITDLIDQYNDLLGYICLAFCGNMIVNMLVPINMALLFIRGIPVHAKFLQYSSESIGSTFIGFCAFWVVFPCVSLK